MTNNSTQLSISKEKRIRGEVKNLILYWILQQNQMKTFFLWKCIKLGIRIKPKAIIDSYFNYLPSR